MSDPDDQPIPLLLHTAVNQISIVATYLGLIRDTELDDEQREMVDEMSRANDASLDIIRTVERRLPSPDLRQ